MPLRKTSLIAALAVLYFGPGMLFFYVARGADESRAEGAPGESPWSATMIEPGEPGEALHVTGTVYGEDGETPAAGVIVYAYHTDATGVYNEPNDNTNPRLKATVVTDARGRYELETIKPAPYPGGGVPAHIHFRLSGGGFPDQRRDLNFEGDPYLSARAKERSAEQGTFGPVRPLERAEGGGWRVVFDMRLRR